MELNGMEEALKLILNEIKDLKTDINDLKQDVTDIKDDVSVLKQDVTVLKDDVSVLKHDVTVLKDDVSVLKHDVTVLKDDVSVLKHDVIILKDGQERIETKVDNLSSELRSDFKYTNDKLDEHRNIFELVSDEIKSVKIDIEYLSSKTGKHDTELNNIIVKLRG